MNKKILIIIAAVLLAVILVVVIAVCAKRTPLPAYDASQDALQATAIPDSSWGTRFTDQNAGVSLMAPKDFTHVVKGGYETFIHQASEAYLQIQNLDYDPTVLTVDANTLGQSVQSSGGTLEDYQKISNTSYFFSYYLEGRHYEKLVLFDMDSVVVVEFCVPNDYLQVFNGMGDKVLNSVKYTPDNPFPANYIIEYSDYGTFQYGVPEAWQTSLENGVLYGADPTTGAEMMLTVFEADITFDGYSQIDFVADNSRDYSRYVCSSYYATANELQAFGQYNFNGESRYLIQYLMISDGLVYQLYFTCPIDTYTNAQSTIDTITSLFKLF